MSEETGRVGHKQQAAAVCVWLERAKATLRKCSIWLMFMLAEHFYCDCVNV